MILRSAKSVNGPLSAYLNAEVCWLIPIRTPRIHTLEAVVNDSVGFSTF